MAYQGSLPVFLVRCERPDHGCTREFEEPHDERHLTLSLQTSHTTRGRAQGLLDSSKIIQTGLPGGIQAAPQIIDENFLRTISTLHRHNFGKEPILSYKEGRLAIESCEVLLRPMIEGKRYSLFRSPQQVLDVAKEEGTTEKILFDALAYIEKDKNAGKKSYHVNAFLSDLEDACVMETLIRTTQMCQSLTVEILEEVIWESFSSDIVGRFALENIKKLQKAGVKIAIDDYSPVASTDSNRSVEILAALMKGGVLLDTIKYDGNFVRMILTEIRLFGYSKTLKGHFPVLRELQKRGVEIVAEWVESLDDIDLLSRPENGGFTCFQGRELAKYIEGPGFERLPEGQKISRDGGTSFYDRTH